MATTQRFNGEKWAELRKPLYAYVGAGDLALEKLREASAELPKLPASLHDEAGRLQESLIAEIHRLQEIFTSEKMPTGVSVEQLRELPEHAREVREHLEDYTTSMADRASDVYHDLVARGERVVSSRR